MGQNSRKEGTILRRLFCPFTIKILLPMEKLNFIFSAAFLLATGLGSNLSAQTLTVNHTTAGSLEAETTAALDGSDAATITQLTITGETLDNTDATYLKSTFGAQLEVLDISGVSFTNKSITDKLCQKMTALKTVTLPADLAKIGKYAFDGCSSLETVNWTLVGNIDDYAFQNCAILKISALPENLTRVGQYGFSKCAEITITKLPAQLTGFGTRAFEFCSKLAITEVPDGVTEIKERVFDRTGITNFTFPNSVATIGDLAFYAEGNPTRTFTCRNEVAPELGDRSFGAATGISNTTARILKKHADAYTAWGEAGLTIAYLSHHIAVSIEGEGTANVEGSALATETNVVEDGTEIEVYEGETLTLTVDPAATIKLNGEKLTPDSDGENSYTIAVGEDDMALEITFSTSTGIEALDANEVSCSVYNKTLYITGEPAAPAEIFNCVGSHVLSTHEQTVDLSRFAKGIYIVKIGQRTFKVINK